VQAVRAAWQIQGRMAAKNLRRPEAEQMSLRIGVHQGDVVAIGADLFGDGVNVASRLEPRAPVGGICVSDRVREDTVGRLNLPFEDQGEVMLKGIDRRVRIPFPPPPEPAFESGAPPSEPVTAATNATTVQDQAQDPWLPETVGKYRLGDEIGRGGMGQVVKGWDQVINRQVAIKILRLPYDRQADAETPLRRFRQEVAAAGGLQHPNIASIYDYGETASFAYIVMEFVDGPALKRHLETAGRLAPGVALGIIDGVLAGLECSHGLGIVHRDIKPGNILIAQSGAAKIVDFGVAMRAFSHGDTGTIAGTSAYMSPEQLAGDPMDRRTDIFSAGIVLYEMLTGQLPFDGAPQSVAYQIAHADPPPPSRLSPGLSPALDAVVMTALAKRPAERFASAAAFAAALRAANAPPANEHDAAQPEPAARHNLPVEITSFIGREQELAEINATLQQRRRLTLVGSGGVGKTRAALRVATEAVDLYRDGVWLVELAPLADPGLVAEAVCRVVSAPISGGRSPVDVAVAFLRQKQMLLILDNCEHLLGAAAELVARLLAQCPALCVLTTSREPLRIPGEVVYRLPALPVPGPADGLTAEGALRFASVRLFVQRAADAGGFYRLTDADAPAVARICRRVDGVAMAIELAAARARVLKPAEIAKRLDDAFRLLNTGTSAALPHQKTLWATIDWSHSLLSPAEQCLLRRLSVYVDGFSLDGAIAAATGGPIDADDVLDLVELLIDKSLLNADMSGRVTRFRMLETTRHYAREKLKASLETGGDRQAASYLGDFFKRAETTWPTTQTEAWLAEFAPEVENLRSSIDWAFGQSHKYHAPVEQAGSPELGIALVASAGCIAEEMSLEADMKRWTATALNYVTQDTPPAQAGWVKFWATKWQSVFGAAEVSSTRREAIALFRKAGDSLGLSCALRTTAMAIARPGNMPPEVEPMLTEAIELLRRGPANKDYATALAHMGSFHYFNNNLTVARRYYDEAQVLRRQLGDRTGMLASALNHAELECASGQPELAIRYARQAIDEARRAGCVAILANLLANLAGYLLAINNAAGAREAAKEALVLNRALDHHDWSVPCLEHLALAYALSGEPLQAARLLGYTEGYFQRTNQARDRLEQAGRDRLVALLQDSLTEADHAVLRAEGEAWTEDAADMAALKDVTQDGRRSASAFAA
jgi:predicted ATPase